MIHYTGTVDGPATVRSLQSPVAQASAHLVLDRDGALTKLVRFDRVAWHAGKSRWAGGSGCNAFTVGIEVVNPGPLRRNWEEYRDVYGRRWGGPAVEARHKNGSAF